ncbi:hypothetical protein KC678_01115 [Candidatus Dojkabacteria bacterium]|uniref:Uncharacterized protein n=1 Tax=Candidatus Dojkabacteria bacterium TaxID=2099670 RepID=A0A955I8Y1_9BACT|nr:hypothetical protein [Candidatus Dojkabacteria bacterium]
MGDSVYGGGGYNEVSEIHEVDSIEEILSPSEIDKSEEFAQNKMRSFVYRSVVGVLLCAQFAIGIDNFFDANSIITKWSDLQDRLGLLKENPKLNNQDPSSKYYGNENALIFAASEAKELIDEISEHTDLILEDFSELRTSSIQFKLHVLGTQLGLEYDLNSDGVFDINPELLGLRIDSLIAEMKSIEANGEKDRDEGLAKTIGFAIATLLAAYITDRHISGKDSDVTNFTNKVRKDNLENRKQRRAKEAKERKEEKKEKRKNSEKRKNEDNIHVAGNGTSLTDEEIIRLMQDPNKLES